MFSKIRSKMQERESMDKKRLVFTIQRSLLLIMAGWLLAGQFTGAEAAAPKVRKIAWTDDASKIYIPVRSSKKLQVEITPKKARKNRLKWSSSNANIATVNKNGKVSAKKKGTVTVTCKVLSQPQKEIRCKVSVVKPSRKIRVDKGGIVLQKGNTYRRKASIAPESATIKGVRYISSDPKIVTVNKNGKLTGKSEGTAKIRILSEDGFAKEVSYPVKVIGRLKNSARFIAHRGLSSRAPENTIKAFQLAGEAGFWGAETDIRRTKDGYFVLMHDDTLKRMCGIDKTPGDMTLAEIKGSPVTGGNHWKEYQSDRSATTIPTLEEYLQTCLEYRMVPVVEIKMAYAWEEADGQLLSAPEDGAAQPHTGAAAEGRETQKETGALATAAVDAYGMELQSAAEDDLTRLYDITQSFMGNAKVVFIAFDLKTLIKLRAIADERGAGNIELQHLVGKPDTNLIGLYKEKQIGLDTYFKELDIKTAKKFMNSGVAVNIWTVDDPSKMWEYARNKIPYITTNCKFW